MELKVETRNLDMRKSWQEKIEDERTKIVRHYPNYVLHLRVSIEATPGYKEGGYEVRLVATVPHDTVVVKRWGEKVHPLLVEAFDVFGLQLKEIVRKKQNQKKLKNGLASGALIDGNAPGTIHRLFADYGFIVTPDEQEVFFHENSLKDKAIDDLNEGDSVFFSLVESDQGLKASQVRVG